MTAIYTPVRNGEYERKELSVVMKKRLQEYERTYKRRAVRIWSEDKGHRVLMVELKGKGGSVIVEIAHYTMIGWITS
jgi:hypothetical protein